MEKFFKLYKDFFNSKEEKNKFHLNSSELRVLIGVELSRSVLTNTSVIHEDTLLTVINKPLTKRNKTMVREAISSLHNKTIIDIVEESGSVYVITSLFSKTNEMSFNQLPIDELFYVLKEIKSDDLLYLYLAIRAWEYNGQSLNFSNQALANICKVDRRTIQRRTRQLESEKLIKVERVSKQKNHISTLGSQFCKVDKSKETVSVKLMTQESKNEEAKRAFGI